METNINRNRKDGIMKKIPVIIDCDPGHDDAIAILWALSSPKLEIKAVTTVAGNQTLDKVTTNAIKVLTKARRLDIPVARGAAKPMIRKLKTGDIVHGESGLEGPLLPEKGFEESELSALEMLIQVLEESEEKVTLIPVGPLTNIGTLLVVRPDLKAKIDKLYIMGGGMYRGNFTPVAEYNIWADPEAAKVVFQSELPIVMAGLDVTHKAFVTREENEILRSQGNEISVFVAELIDYFSKYHYEVEGFAGCTLHDPAAVAALIYPEIFQGIPCSVDVETGGELTTGMTVVDTIGYKEKIWKEKVVKNTTLLLDVDRKEFVRLFLADMKKLG